MSTAGAALRVVIAEDAAIMRDGLTQTLTRRGLDVVMPPRPRTSGR